MNDPSQPTDVSSDDGALSQDPAAKEAPPMAGFRLGRVLKVVVPLGLLLAAVAAFYALGGPEWVEGLLRPPLVAVEGEVLYKGSPLPNAVVQTQPLGRGLRGAIGSTDEQGRFRLRTDVEGTFFDGAYTGKHKIIVAAYGEPPPGPGGAPLTTPELYASYQTTPLSVDVSSLPDQNRLRLELKGEAPSTPSPPVAPPSDGEDGSSAGEFRAANSADLKDDPTPNSP